MRAALTILGKDLRLRVRDRSVWLFALAVPLGLTLLFSFVLPDPGEVHVEAVVVDADGSDVSRAFVEGVLPVLVDEGLLTLLEDDDPAAAAGRVERGEQDVAWVLAEGLGEAVLAGEPAAIEVLVADGRELAGEIAVGVATAFARQVEQVSLAVATLAAAQGAAPTPDDVAALAAAAGEATPTVSLAERTEDAGAPLDMRSYLAAGMAAFFVFFVVQFGVTGVLEERQQGTMPRLLAAPIGRSTVLVGKLAGALLLGLASMTVLSVASALLLDAAWGPTAGVAVLVVALVIAAVGVMALVAAFARTAEQAGNLQSVVAVVLGLLGGVFFPVPGDGGLLRLANAVSPHGWFLRGLTELSASGDWTVALGPAAVIAAVGTAFLVPGVLLQRRSL